VRSGTGCRAAPRQYADESNHQRKPAKLLHTASGQQTSLDIKGYPTTRVGGHRSQPIGSRQDVIHGKDSQVLVSDRALLPAGEVDDKPIGVVLGRLDDLHDLSLPQTVHFHRGQRVTM
jgi:hypothetical protein